MAVAGSHPGPTQVSTRGEVNLNYLRTTAPLPPHPVPRKPSVCSRTASLEGRDEQMTEWTDGWRGGLMPFRVLSLNDWGITGFLNV